MKARTLWFALLCVTVFFVLRAGIVKAHEPSCDEYFTYIQTDSELTCFKECEVCVASCTNKYNTPKYDIWGNPREESAVTYWNRVKCKNTCLTIRDNCIKRKRNLEKQNTQTQSTSAPPLQYRNLDEEQKDIDNKVQESQEDPIYEPIPSDTKIYKWTDKNGVVHMTNKKESIPPEYLDQIKEDSGKGEKHINK
jgi:hypothetical protein